MNPTALLIAAVVLLVSCVTQTSAQNDNNPGQLAHDLSFSLSVVFVTVAVVIMVIVAVVILHRAKKGYFCCVKPRIRYPVVKQSRRARSRDAESASTPAPSYEAHPRGSDIAPPDYEDALHDAVVNTEVSNIQGESRDEELGDDASVNYDDSAPLNP